MLRYLRLYAAYTRLSVRALLAYQSSFLVGTMGYMLETGALLFSLGVTFRFVEAIGEWDFWRMLFFYGFMSLSRAFWDTFMGNMIYLSEKVRDGSLDRFLLRPVNPLFQLFTEKWSPDTIGEMMFSSILLGICLNHYRMLTVLSVVKLLLLVVSGMLCFAAMHLASNVTAFWSTDASSLNFLLWRFNEVGGYPLSIFPTWMHTVLTWIIPYGFVAYYPVRWFFSLEGEAIAGLAPIFGPIVFGLACLFWHKGLRRYQSTGS